MVASDDESSIPSTTLVHREVRLRSYAPADDLSRWVAAFETAWLRFTRGAKEIIITVCFFGQSIKIVNGLAYSLLNGLACSLVHEGAYQRFQSYA